MTILDLILLLALCIFAVAVLVICIRGGININFTKRIIEEKRLSEVELEIAKRNLEEISKYNSNAEKDAQLHSEAMRTAAEMMQSFVGARDDE